MIENNLTEEKLIKAEPIVNDLKFRSQIDFNDTIKHSYGVMLNDIKNLGFFVRKLSKRKYLQETTDILSGTNDGSIIEDTLERLRIVLKVNSQDSEEVFKLYGSDSEDMTSSQIVKTLVSTEAGTFTSLLTDDLESETLFRYYQLKKTTSGACNYSAYLIETTFELLHLWLTLAIIFENQTNSNNDVYEQKGLYYREAYQITLNASKFAYDEDDSGEIEEDEKLSGNYTRVTLRRG